MEFRIGIKDGDAQSVRDIIKSSNFFYDYEIDIAVELVEEFQKQGEASGYNFIFLEERNEAKGYVCFGEIPHAKNRYDIYWIAISDECRGQGLGKKLLSRAEEEIMKKGGEIAYIETSSQEKYLPTRMFYEKLGYLKEAEIKNFYQKNDNKIIYSKKLT